MLPFLSQILVLIIALPSIEVQWITKAREQLTIKGPIDVARAIQCLDAGGEVRNRYFLKVCRSRGAVFPECGNELLVNRTLRYDAVGDSYRLSTDILYDRAPAESELIKSRADAIDQVSIVPKVNVGKLVPKDVYGDKLFFSARTISDCKGDYNRFLAKLGYFLTFGLYSSFEDDSGWQSFDLLPKN